MKTLLKILNIFLFSLTFLGQIIAQNVTSKSGKVSFRPLVNNGYENSVDPEIFSLTANVYSQPDTASSVLQVLKFNTSLRLLGEGDDSGEIKTERVLDNGEKFTYTVYTLLRWYKIEWKETIGYVKASDVATHTFRDDDGLFNYFFINKKLCWLFKYDKAKKQFSDSMELKDIRVDIAKTINPKGWKNVKMMFRATMINAFCGGGTTNVFIVDANGKFSELITTKSYYDDGSADGYNSDVWLPIKFETNNILLIANGDVENVFDNYSGRLNTYSYPKELAVPKMELIVLKETQVTSLVDKNGELLLNADRTYKSKTKQWTSYLRWNGTKLIKIK